jgi:hypothetical protein
MKTSSYAAQPQMRGPRSGRVMGKHLGTQSGRLATFGGKGRETNNNGLRESAKNTLAEIEGEELPLPSD